MNTLLIKKHSGTHGVFWWISLCDLLYLQKTLNYPYAGLDGRTVSNQNDISLCKWLWNNASVQINSEMMSKDRAE